MEMTGEMFNRLTLAAIVAEGRNLNVDALSDEPQIEEIAARFRVSPGDMCNLMMEREQAKQGTVQEYLTRKGHVNLDF